jgi:hypothetical protein
MTKEEKDLLLNDLCARLRYGVKISVQSWDEREMEYIDKVDVLYSVNGDEYIKSVNEDYDFSIEDIKPYLLPLSSMTEGQKKELQSLMISDSYGILYHTLESFNYMCKNNIDFRGLIPKGLAIDATELNIY